MAQSKNSFLSALASSITSSGTVPTVALAPEVTADIEGAGTAVYDSASLLPIAGHTAGDQAFAGNRLYISNGSGWYNVGLVNVVPSINSGPDGAKYTLDSNGGTATSITLSASDSDGTPIIWSYATSDSAYELVDISNDSNGTFTFTSKSLTDILAAGYDSAGGSFDVTFKASDGISFDTDLASFTLSFAVSSVDWSTPRRSVVYPDTSMSGFDGNEYFGWDHDISPNGQILAGGAKGWNGNIGAVQFFSLESDGSTSYLSYFNGSTNYNTGDAVTFIDDQTIAAGAPVYSGGTGYVSIRRSTDNWNSISALTNIFAFGNGGQFGTSLEYDPGSRVLWIGNLDNYISRTAWAYNSNPGYPSSWAEYTGYTTLNTNYTNTGLLSTGQQGSKGISVNGDRAAIGLRNYDFTGVNGSGTSISNCGGVDLVDRTANTANFNLNPVFLPAENPQVNGRFGDDVALLDDILIVGASGETIDGYTYQGAVYCYTTDDSGASWDLNQRLVDSDTLDTSSSRFYGTTVRLTKVSDTEEYLLAIGAPADNAIYVYGSEDKTTWTYKNRLVSPSADGNYGFGSLRWNNEGTMITVGQYANDSAGTNYGKVDIWTNT